MWIEIGASCSLLLGLAPGNGPGRLNAVSATLQYPPVHLFAQAQAGPLNVTGARAPLVYQSAERFLAHQGLHSGANIEIELATPSLMGLASDPMLALATARALAALNDLPTDAPALAHAVGLGALEAACTWGFEQGGLVEADLQTGALVRRREIAHDQKADWVFVFHFPHTPTGVPATLEADCLRALAASNFEAEGARTARDALWQAAENDDFSAFAAALMGLTQANRQALSASGADPALPQGEQAILDTMRDFGAPAWGQTLTGLAVFALVQGGEPSRQLRRRIKDKVGHEGGIVMATVVDNQGARQNTHNTRPVLQGA